MKIEIEKFLAEEAFFRRKSLKSKGFLLKNYFS